MLTPISRRRVVAMLGMGAAGAALAACAAPAPTATPAPAKPAEAPKPAAPAEPTKPAAAAPAAATNTPAAAAAAATNTPAAAPKPAEPTKPAAATPTNTPAAAAAAKPAPTATPPPPALKTGQKLLTVMYNAGEFKDDHIAAYEKVDPNTRVYRVNTDHVQLVAMTSAGTPPDIYRVQAPDIPSFLTRKMVKDLTPYFRDSKLIKIDDLADANKNYWFEGFTPGRGKIHGMTKDWSPDLTLYANKKLFQAAGVEVPSDEKPLTYQQITELAQKLTKKAGDRTEVIGFAYNNPWFDRMVEVQLNEKGTSLWAPDFSQLKLQTPEAKEALQYWFDLDKKNVTFNPLNPSTSWSGDQFTKNQVALVQYGYWFSAMAESDDTKGNVVKLPSPTWGPQHKSPTITATGHLIHDKTKVVDEAWKVFEWFSAGEPSVERAKSGWGVPALKSQWSMMPTETPFQKQVQKVLQGELKMSDVAVKYNPYINVSETVSRNTFTGSYFKHLEGALKGQITFDQLLANVEKEVNAAIKEGMERLA
jgi:multiple sugar transport system substrate-binding protein